MKDCTGCGVRQPLSSFYADSAYLDGYRGRCKTCVYARVKEWRSRNPEHHAEKSRMYYIENRSRIKERVKRSSLVRRYGITFEQVQRLRADQNGRCAICSLEIELVVDHCHVTGKVRGLLCDSCNVAIGRLKDDPDLVLAAWRYLTR